MVVFIVAGVLITVTGVYYKYRMLDYITDTGNVESERFTDNHVSSADVGVGAISI